MSFSRQQMEQGHKVRKSESQIMRILSGVHEGKNSQLITLDTGKHSQAYSYVHDDLRYVLRLSTNDTGFKKDEYAHKYFQKGGVRIPRIVALGELDISQYYCISEAIEGDSVRDQYNQNDYSSFTRQFETIEQIRSIAPPSENFGTLSPEGDADLLSLRDHVESEYAKHNWDEYEKLEYFDRSWLEDIRSSLHNQLSYSSGVHDLVHGDFGNHNVFIRNGEVAGVIDWEKSYCGDAFYDVGRVVLYCPRRDLSAQAALDYYSKTKHTNYRERILAGVYFTMMINYGMAARAGKKSSCSSSPARIQEIEEVLLSKEY